MPGLACPAALLDHGEVRCSRCLGTEAGEGVADLYALPAGRVDNLVGVLSTQAHTPPLLNPGTGRRTEQMSLDTDNLAERFSHVFDAPEPASGIDPHNLL